MPKTTQEFTKYERARIIGARALQLAMDAPLLLKTDEKELEAMNFDPLKMAQKELDTGVLPIAIHRPMPDKREEKLKEVKVGDYDEKDKEDIDVPREDADGGELPKLEIKDAPPLKADDEAEEEAEDEGLEETIEDTTGEAGGEGGEE